MLSPNKEIKQFSSLYPEILDLINYFKSLNLLQLLSFPSKLKKLLSSDLATNPLPLLTADISEKHYKKVPGLRGFSESLFVRTVKFLHSTNPSIFLGSSGKNNLDALNKAKDPKLTYQAMTYLNEKLPNSSCLAQLIEEASKSHGP